MPFIKDRLRSKSELLEIFSRLIYLPHESKTLGDNGCTYSLSPSTESTLLLHIVKDRRSLLTIKGPRLTSKIVWNEKRETGKLEAGPMTCCYGLLCESCEAIFFNIRQVGSIFVLVSYNEVIPVHKGFKDPEQHIKT
ncbi:hypothetical protein EAG_02086 [Camponotus floridanus]|uniref:Uncharacterized protein n=1 Tax=Camponotus floridanus TaxID=104421 RepID=E2B1L8_CAMFO|nr:hypothetical protein EAG_02086 [Camponotus floridanus]